MKCFLIAFAFVTAFACAGRADEPKDAKGSATIFQQKWEFKTLTTSNPAEISLPAREGWEVVGVTNAEPRTDGYHYVFKRPIVPGTGQIANVAEEHKENRIQPIDGFRGNLGRIANPIEARPIDQENAAVVEGVRRALVELGLEEKPAEEGKPIQFHAGQATLIKLKQSNVISLLPNGTLLVGREVDAVKQRLEKATEPKRK